MAANEWDIVATGDEALARNLPSTTEAPDQGGGASFLQRVGASFKSSPESEANFYGAQLGKENVRLTRDKQVEIRDLDTGKWKRANPEGLDIGDIGGFVGELPAALGAAGGALVGGAVGLFGGGVGAIPGAIAGGAAGAGLGNVFKQAVGATMPGEDTETLGQRAGEVGLNAALGAVGEGAGQLAYHGVIRPVAQGIARGALAQGAGPAAEAGAIEAAINRGRPAGGPSFAFTPGEATGNRTLQMVEEAARKDVSGSQLFAERTAQDVAALRDKATRMIDEVYAGQRPMSDLATGTEVKSMFHQIDDLMLDSLEQRAAKDFAPLKTGPASRMQFDTPALKNTLAHIAAADVNSAGKAGPVAEGVTKILEDLPEKMTAKDIDLYLKRWGRLGYGKGDQTFMEKLGDTDRAKMGRMLFASLSKDVEDIATSQQPGHTIANALRNAKDNFKAGLQEIDAWQNGLFAKVVGDKGPESAGRIVDNLYKLNPDELKSVMTVVGYRPEVANAVRANWVERAFTKSQEKMMSKAGPGPWFDAETFTKALGDSKQIEALFGRTHREVLNDVIMMKRAVARMSSREFNTGTTIAGQSKLIRVLSAVPHPGRWAETAKQILIPRKMTRILLDPNLRHEMRLVANAGAPTQRVVAAMTSLLGQEAENFQERQ